MVLEISAGPGTELYRSTLYAVNTPASPIDQTLYVYGVARNARWTSKIAATGAPITMSWVTLGTDATINLRITRLAGAITSLIVYPLHLGIDYEISGSDVSITVPKDTRLMLEFNGEQAKPLMIFANNLKTAVAGVNPVDTFTNIGAFPSATTGRTLYFGPGVWTIGQLYDVPTGSRVYLDDGAWVIGSFDVRGRDNWTIEGPGVLSGEWEDGLLLDRTQPFDDLVLYSMILGYDGVDYFYSDTTLRDITMVSAPFYHIADGVNYCVGVKMLTPWWENSDGIGITPDQSDVGVGQGSRATANDNFMYVGDDAIRIVYSSGDKTADGNFCVNTGSSAIMLLYRSDASTPGETTITNTTIVSKASDYYPGGTSGPNSASSIKLWIDGAEDVTNARRGVTIDRVYVEGPGTTPLFTIENNLYPWGASADAFGQAYDITISDVTMASNPAERSRLRGRDAVNTPHDITFTGITIAGVVVDVNNWSTYVDQNAFPYGIALDGVAVEVDPIEPQIPPTDPAFIVEDGSGLANADSYLSVAEANARAIARGSPSAWSAGTSAQKRNWLRQAASSGIDLVFGGLWRGYRRMETQALDWPRIGAFDCRTGRAVQETAIPLGVKWAQFEFALALAGGLDPLANVDATDPGERVRWATSTTDRIPGGFEESRTYAKGSPVFPLLVRMHTFAGPLLESDDRVMLA